MFAIMAWVTLAAGTLFYIMNRLGLFRVDAAVEVIGLDISELGGMPQALLDKIKMDFLEKMNLNNGGNGKDLNFSNTKTMEE
jgi:hypothetical protein